MAAFQAINLYPSSGTAVDFSQANTFTALVQGDVDKYEAVIRRIDNSVQLYTTGEVTLSPTLVDGDTLNINIIAGSITYTGEVKWQLTTFNGTAEAETREIAFFSSTAPNLSMSIASPVENKNVNLSATYSQAQNIDIERHVFNIYDSNNVLVRTSNDVFNSRLTFLFDEGRDGQSYSAECIVTDIEGTVSTTGRISFEVDYDEPSLGITPSATIDNCTSAVTVSYGSAVQIIGTSTGSTSYIDDFLTVENVGLRLQQNSNVRWNFDIPETFQTEYYGTIDATFTGILMTFHGSPNYDVGYDGTKFYINVDGTMIEGNNLVLNTDPYFIVAVFDRVFIIQNQVLLDTVKLL